MQARRMVVVVVAVLLLLGMQAAQAQLGFSLNAADESSPWLMSVTFNGTLINQGLDEVRCC